MAKAKAPRWLTQSFADGVVEQMPLRPAPAYKGALGRCWLAQHDERQRPCSGRLERAHLISRQRVENALGALLPSPAEAQVQLARQYAEGLIEPDWVYSATDLILLAAWCPRNGVIACQHHHRRLDGHGMPELVVPFATLPDHVLEFAEDWGIEGQLDRFPD